MISDIIEKKRRELLDSEPAPQKENDYIASFCYQYLAKLNRNVPEVITKGATRVEVRKSGKQTRYELQGKPIEVTMGGQVVTLPVCLVAYEDRDGISNAYYVATDKEHNRVMMRYLVKDGEVAF